MATLKKIMADAKAAQKRATARSAEIANRGKPSNFTYGAGNPLNTAVDPYIGKPEATPTATPTAGAAKASVPISGVPGLRPSGSGNPVFQMLGGILYYDGKPYSGEQGNKTYSGGMAVTPTEDSGSGQLATLQSQIDALTLQLKNQSTSSSEASLKEKKEANDIMAALTAKFTNYNLASLIPKIKELAISGVGEATIIAELAATEEYKTRFSANQDRIKKNLAVLSPAEYLAVEDGYRQTLRAYGLTQFDNDAYVKQFISNDISPTELSNRVVTAVQRVRNADPAIQTQLKEYYGIGDTDLVAYVLDPLQQFQKIERQVAAAEIGVAAGRQGLKAGVNVAEQLAAQGITQAEAQKGYATIADILPTAEKLSDIYGTTLEGYDQSSAEQEIFNSLASAQRARKKLTQAEIASFSGSSGTSKNALTGNKSAGAI